MQHRRRMSRASRRRHRRKQRSTLRRRISRLIGGDCGCGSASVAAANAGAADLHHTNAYSSSGPSPLVGGSLTQPFPAPFFSMPYNAYPLNNHMMDPNNPGTVTSAGQPPHGMHTGGRRKRGSRRMRRGRGRGRRSRARRPRMSGGGAGLMFSNFIHGSPSTDPVNLVDQIGTVSGAQTLANAVIQPGQLSNPGIFSEMTPGTAHNPVYV